MSNLFDLFIDLTISGTVAAFVVLIARILLRKAPRQLSYLMWVVVFMRFAIPFSAELPILPAITVQGGVTQGTLTVPDISAGVAIPDIGAAIPSITEALPQAQNVTEVFVNIWLAGVIVLFIYMVASYIIIKIGVRFAIKEKGRIYRCDDIKTPFVLGVINPKIYLPSNISQEDFNNIVLHEQAHINRFDHLTKPVFFAITMIHWFNPFAWIAYHFMNNDMEMACDERAVAKKENIQKVGYAESLLRFATDRRLVFSPLFSVGNPERRIINILNHRKVGVIINLLLLLVPVLFLLVSFSKITHPVNIITSPPVVNTVFTQPMAQLDKGELLQDSKYMLPLSDFKVSRSYNLSNGYIEYWGLDMTAEKGSEIYASAAGTVIEVQKEPLSGYGKYLVIEHDNKIFSLYAHCDDIMVEQGQVVEQGEIVAEVGSTGNSAGSQLHFEVRNDLENIDISASGGDSALEYPFYALYNPPQVEQAINYSYQQLNDSV